MTPFQTKCCNSTLATKSLSFSSTAESWLMNFQLQLPIRILVDRKMKCFTRYLSLGNWVLAKPPLSSDTFINILANIIEQLLVLTLLSKWLIGMLIRLLDYKCGTLLAKYVFKCDFCVIPSVQTSFGWKYSYRKSQIRKIKNLEFFRQIEGKSILFVSKLSRIFPPFVNQTDFFAFLFKTCCDTSQNVKFHFPWPHYWTFRKTKFNTFFMSIYVIPWTLY